MSDFIPMGIWSEIFKKATAETLIRCKCVCKSWKSLICSSSFIDAHLAALKQTNDLILRRPESETYVIFRPQSLTSFNISFQQNLLHTFRILGTANGVVCLVKDTLYSYRKIVVLWNPLINNLLQIPKCTHANRSLSTLVFGFDSTNNDFKIMNIVWEGILHLHGRKTLSQPSYVEVFSVQEWKWREVKFDSSNLHSYVNYVIFENLSSQCLLNGAAHWPSVKLKEENLCGRGKTLLTAFHFEKEEFKTIHLPQELLSSSKLGIQVSKFGSMLSVLSHKTVGCDIWAMQEYGVVSSWCKMLSFNWDTGMRFRALWVREEKGDIIALRYDQELVFYDPNSQHTSLLGVKCNGHEYFAEGFVGSLVFMDYDQFGTRTLVD